MSTNDDKPSVFAKYINDPPEKERLVEPKTMQAGSTDLVSQWTQANSVKTFLKNILAHGPEPTTVVMARGVAHGFSERQLRRARERMGIVAFKEQKFGGRWFWTVTQLTPEQVTAVKHHDRYTRRLREITNILGYRLYKKTTKNRPRA